MNTERTLRARWTRAEAVAVDTGIMEADLRLLDTTTNQCNGTYYGGTPHSALRLAPKLWRQQRSTRASW